MRCRAEPIAAASSLLLSAASYARAAVAFAADAAWLRGHFFRDSLARSAFALLDLRLLAPASSPTLRIRASCQSTQTPASGAAARAGSMRVISAAGFTPAAAAAFAARGRERGLLRPAFHVRIDDDLVVVAQVHRLEFLELLPPLLHVARRRSCSASDNPRSRVPPAHRPRDR